MAGGGVKLEGSILPRTSLPSVSYLRKGCRRQDAGRLSCLIRWFSIMATTAPQPPSADLVASPVSTVPAKERPVPPPKSSGLVWIGLSVGAVLILVIGTGVFLWVRNVVGGTDLSKLKLHPVSKSDLVVTVVEDGNLESAQNVEIKSRVEGTTTILKIVEDGSRVKKGDVLVELDSAALEEQITQQRIAVNRAEATMVQAEKDLEVAIISKQEYAEGTFRQQLQDAEAQITIALENLRTAENTLAHTERMFRKGYVSKLQLESQQFAVKTAKLNLASAETAKEVLVKYTKPKMLEDLQAQIDAARTRASSEKEAYELELAKLKRLEEQLKNCTIVAPQDGMVVYANERSGRFGSQQGVQIEEGASVRERQTILRLPDLDRMQVKVNVHESKVEDLAVGMEADIKVQDRTFHGKVVSIASQPEPTSWFSGNIKEYATIVRIDGQPKNLKPGMTAEVTIKVAELKDVLTVPVSAVVEIGDRFYCWVASASGIQRRELKLGLTNDEFVEVKDGVVEGDLVIRNPLAVVPERERTEIEASEKARADEGTRGGGKSAKSGAGHGAKSGGRKKSGRMMDFKQLDKNGDGVVTKDELPERAQGYFDRMDANGDGKIDAQEQEAIRKRFSGAKKKSSGGEARKGGSGEGGGSSLIGRFDQDGDGKISKDEAPSWMQGAFERFDKNGDGFIDSSEVEAMRRNRKKQ